MEKNSSYSRFQEMREEMLDSVEESIDKLSGAFEVAKTSSNIDDLNAGLEALEVAARKVVIEITLQRSKMAEEFRLQMEECEYEQERLCRTECEACGVPYTIGHCDDCPLRD